MTDLTTCEHPDIELGNCLACGTDVPDEREEPHYNPGPRKLYPRDVLSTDDLNLLSELVAEATESRERKARDDVFEASYHRHQAKVYRDFLTKVTR